MDNPLLYTVDEAAQLLSISRAALYPRVIAGEVESITIGRSRRIPRQALLDFIENARGLGLDSEGFQS